MRSNVNYYSQPPTAPLCRLSIPWLTLTLTLTLAVVFFYCIISVKNVSYTFMSKEFPLLHSLRQPLQIKRRLLIHIIQPIIKKQMSMRSPADKRGF